MLKAYIFNAKDHPLHTDMPNSEEYVKCGESTLITTGKVFSLHHSATISYHFDKIFTPNALEITLLSNDVKLHANDWTFLKISAVEREIDNIFCEISSFITEKIKYNPFFFPINPQGRIQRGAPPARPPPPPKIGKNMIFWRKIMHISNRQRILHICTLCMLN